MDPGVRGSSPPRCVSSDPGWAAPHLGLPSSALLDEGAGHGGAHRVALEEASQRVAQTQRHQLLEWTQSECVLGIMGNVVVIVDHLVYVLGIMGNVVVIVDDLVYVLGIMGNVVVIVDHLVAVHLVAVF